MFAQGRERNQLDASNTSRECSELQKVYARDPQVQKRLREDDATAKEIIEERKEKNRRSAQLSRRRKLEQQKCLTDLINVLSTENENLKQVNEAIAKELILQKVENARLRQVLSSTLPPFS
jgi:bZIP transcription factor